MFYNASRIATYGLVAAAIARDDAMSSGKAGPSPENAGKILLLQQDVERLLMITESLWDILKEKHGYTDEELRRRVADIDLRDGKLDGRVAPMELPDCPQCGRKPQRHRPLCLYCGQALVNNPFQR